MIFNLLQVGDAELLETGVQAVAEVKKLNLISMAVSGGWLMIVLLILSIAAIYIFGNKWWMIRKAGMIDKPNGHEFEQALEDTGGQGSLACCSPRGRKEPDMIE